MTLSLEKLALAKVRETFPHLQRRGFRRAILQFEPGIFSGKINFTPDGWCLEFVVEFFEDDRNAYVFTCIEIEDNNPLSPEKLWPIANCGTRWSSTATVCGSLYSTDMAIAAASLISSKCTSPVLIRWAYRP
jgi:hypothetical protein